MPHPADFLVLELPARSCRMRSPTLSGGYHSESEASREFRRRRRVIAWTESSNGWIESVERCCWIGDLYFPLVDPEFFFRDGGGCRSLLSSEESDLRVNRSAVTVCLQWSWQVIRQCQLVTWVMMWLMLLLVVMLWDGDEEEKRCPGAPWTIVHLPLEWLALSLVLLLVQLLCSTPSVIWHSYSGTLASLILILDTDWIYWHNESPGRHGYSPHSGKFYKKSFNILFQVIPFLQIMLSLDMLERLLTITFVTLKY